MAARHDRRWPGAEAVVAAAVGIGREIARASVSSSPPGRRRQPDGPGKAGPAPPTGEGRKPVPKPDREPAGSGQPGVAASAAAGVPLGAGADIEAARPGRAGVSPTLGGAVPAASADPQPSPPPEGGPPPDSPPKEPVPASPVSAGRTPAGPQASGSGNAGSSHKAAHHGASRTRATSSGPDQRRPATTATTPRPPARAHRAPRQPPDRTLDIVRRRSSRFQRAAWRVGGPDWGVRLTMSLIIALMLLTVTGFAFERLTGVDVLPDGPAARFWPAPRDFPVLGRSAPVSIRARAVRIDAPVHSVGNAAGGAIDVPAGKRLDEAGWYSKGPTPGEYGPAVIVGHVDNGDGPSVFHKLSRLRPGNRVEVGRADGSVAVFEVNTVKRYDRDDLPADEVFGDFSRPGLRLITCGGRWVGGTTGYADNVVVYASLVRTRSR